MNIISRREFLKACSACAACAGASMLTPKYSGISGLFWGPQNAQAAPFTKTVVFLIFDGGISLNMAPHLSSVYTTAQAGALPSLTNAIQVVPGQVLHPALSSLGPVVNNNQLLIANNIGLDGLGDRSHDVASEGMGRGTPTRNGDRRSFVDRIADAAGGGVAAFSLSGTTDYASGDAALTFSPEDGGEESAWGEHNTAHIRDTRQILLGNADLSSFAKAKVLAVNSRVDQYVNQLAAATNITLGATFPNTSIGRQFESAAKLILSNIGVRAININMGGFDTHSDEATRLTQLMTSLNAALAPFIQVLAAANKWQEIVLMTLSEFGRTTQANASGGTDHGRAYPSIIMGGGIRGGQRHGMAPDNYFNGNKYYLDFINEDYRSLVSAILANMGIDIGSVFPGMSPANGLFI